MKSVYLAIPVYRDANVRCMLSVERTIESSVTCNVDIHWCVGESDIARARNRQVSDFYHNEGYDYYITLDSDIELLNVNEGDNAFDQLTSHTHLEAIVGALISKKVESTTECTFASVPMRSCSIKKNMGLVEMRWLGAGLMCVSRNIVKRMVDAYPDLSCISTQGHKREYDYALYMQMLVDIAGKRKYLSEDWAFCERAGNIGIPIFADTSVNGLHWGDKGYDVWNGKTEWMVRVGNK